MKIVNKILLKIYLICVFLVLYAGEGFGLTELPDVESPKWTKKYDHYFRKYAKRYFGAGFDYFWFKSQAIAESKLKKDAKSWVGAKGLMQIMPRTFEEIRERNPSFKHVSEPRWNIAAGIYYDRKMFKFWKDDRPFLDKMGFAFASYNAGAQNILKGQKYCLKMKGDECNLWKEVESFGPKVKTWRHRETIHYLKEIFRLMKSRI